MKKIFILLVITSTLLNCNEVKKTKLIPQKNEIKNSSSNQNDCLNDFNQFFEKFAKDSIFQKEHVRFPFKYYYHEDIMSDNFSIEIIKSKNFYKYIDFTEDQKAMEYEYDKFTVEKIEAKGKVIYKRIGYDNGINIEYTFNLIDGCWYLISITDTST
jgi:hypothetical protein